ncbi:MAG: hypothetical protein R2822_18865 [Spirosomataceae bacterium]
MKCCMYVMMGCVYILLQGICPVFAQNQTIVLKAERLKVQPKGFFIAEVVDNRTIKSTIGKIWSRPQPLSMSLQGGTAKGIENFLHRHFNPSKTDTLTPIIVTIREFTINEVLTPTNRVNGEIRMDLGFETYREGKRVYLTGGKAATTYTRAGIVPEEVIEPLIRKLLENQMKGFNDWFAKGIKTSDLLVKEVKLIFEEETGLVSDGDTVYYHPKRLLTWQDFLGVPSPLSRYAAQVFTSFGFEARSSVANRVLELRVKTKVWIDKSISWVRTNAKNDYVLDHEQLHFDITRLAAERFKRHLLTMRFSVEDYSSELQYEYLEYYKLHTQLQEQYDNETNHGINTTTQAQWVKKVRDELSGYGIK